MGFLECIHEIESSSPDFMSRTAWTLWMSVSGSKAKRALDGLVFQSSRKLV